jgi:hypothetical protein
MAKIIKKPLFLSAYLLREKPCAKGRVSFLFARGSEAARFRAA